MIPPDIFIALTLTVLFLVQNTKQLITQSKAQIRMAVIKLSVIKGRVFGKTDRKLYSVLLFLGRCFCPLFLGYDHFQMVICRIFR